MHYPKRCRRGQYEASEQRPLVACQPLVLFLSACKYCCHMVTMLYYISALYVSTPEKNPLPYVEEVVRAGILHYSTVKSMWATAMAAFLLKLAVSAMWKCGRVFSRQLFLGLRGAYIIRTVQRRRENREKDYMLPQAPST